MLKYATIVLSNPLIHLDNKNNKEQDIIPSVNEGKKFKKDIIYAKIFIDASNIISPI
jgi:hypothetical protein